MAKYDIGLIASDIDDTLLPKGGKISEATKMAAAKCAERGIYFGLATGRWYPSTVSVAKEAGCSGPLIVANGGCVVSLEGEILKEFPMKDEDVRTAYDIIKDTGVFITSYVRGAIYRLNTHTMENGPREKTSYYGGNEYEVIDNEVERFEKEAMTGVYKMECYSNDPEILKSLRARLENAGLSISSSFKTNIEITSMGLGKGCALKWLAGHLGIDVSRTMAFGDNTNDMQNIMAAGVGVAMGNAVDELKACADEIAPPCKEDGLAKFLEENVF